MDESTEKDKERNHGDTRQDYPFVSEQQSARDEEPSPKKRLRISVGEGSHIGGQPAAEDLDSNSLNHSMPSALPSLEQMRRASPFRQQPQQRLVPQPESVTPSLIEKQQSQQNSAPQPESLNELSTFISTQQVLRMLANPALQLEQHQHEEIEEQSQTYGQDSSAVNADRLSLSPNPIREQYFQQERATDTAASPTANCMGAYASQQPSMSGKPTIFPPSPPPGHAPMEQHPPPSYFFHQQAMTATPFQFNEEPNSLAFDPHQHFPPPHAATIPSNSSHTHLQQQQFFIFNQQQEVHHFSNTAMTASSSSAPENNHGSSSSSTVAAMPGTTNRPPICIAMQCDKEFLSDYQCLVREQIEVFEAGFDDIESNAQGRNRRIVLGQVGVQCRHCAFLPPKNRSRGAIYYPNKLQGLYQAAQNMASTHLCQHCHNIPTEVKANLLTLRERKSFGGGGKKYWADAVRVLGVYETEEDGLRFYPMTAASSSTSQRESGRIGMECDRSVTIRK